MNTRYSFDPKKLAEETRSLEAAKHIVNWDRLCLRLAKLDYSRHEAEAILKTLVHVSSKPLVSSREIVDRIAKIGLLHGSPGMNSLVLATFPELVPNEYGVPCRRTKNLMSQKDILVPVDTPLSCDLSSETYWSM